MKRVARRTTKAFLCTQEIASSERAFVWSTSWCELEYMWGFFAQIWLDISGPADYLNINEKLYIVARIKKYHREFGPDY